jgi:hypothetical protein
VTLHAVPPPKIPSTCRLCGEPLSLIDMRTFLEECERKNKKPLDAGRKGVLCLTCHARLVTDALDDPEHPLHERLQAASRQVGSREKRDEIGLRSVPKKP